MADQKPTRKKSALGRGLGALLEDSPAKNSTKTEEILPEVVKTGIFEILIKMHWQNLLNPSKFKGSFSLSP